MERVSKAAQGPDDDLHMGSEYANARRYLAQRPRHDPVPRIKSSADPQHGSNDSEFGIPDQRQD